jgi:hypothetical protein
MEKKDLKALRGKRRQGGGSNPSCVEYPGRRAVSAGVAPRRRSICAGTSLEMDCPLRLRFDVGFLCRMVHGAETVGFRVQGLGMGFFRTWLDETSMITRRNVRSAPSA